MISLLITFLDLEAKKIVVSRREKRLEIITKLFSREYKMIERLDNPMHTNRIDDERDLEQEYLDELEEADFEYDYQKETRMLEKE